MSNTDSFIDEVTEEVRRDKLFAMYRKYGWIAILAVVLLVGGAAWREWSKAQATTQAQDFGDAILGAFDADAGDPRVAALRQIDAPNPRAKAVLDLMIGSELAAADQPEPASQTLREIAVQSDVPEIYRQIANFKALSLPDSGLSNQERRTELQALAIPGSPLRLLAEEQLAMIDIDEGMVDAAIERLNATVVDAEATAGLRRRAAQLIVALGGTPEGL